MINTAYSRRDKGVDFLKLSPLLLSSKELWGGEGKMCMFTTEPQC